MSSKNALKNIALTALTERYKLELELLHLESMYAGSSLGLGPNRNWYRREISRVKRIENNALNRLKALNNAPKK